MAGRSESTESELQTPVSTPPGPPRFSTHLPFYILFIQTQGVLQETVMDFPECKIQGLEAYIWTLRNLADSLENSVKILKRVCNPTRLQGTPMNADAVVLNTAKPGIKIKEPCHTLGEPSFRVVDFPRLTHDDVKSVYANLLIKKFLRNVESYNLDPAIRTEVALQNIDELMAIHINARMAKSGNQWHSFKMVIYELYGRQILLEEALTELRHLKPPVYEGEEECLEEFLEKYECLSQMVKELPPVEQAFKIKVFEALPDELQSYFIILLASGNVTIKDFINLVQEKMEVYHTSKTRRSGQQGSSRKKC